MANQNNGLQSNNNSGITLRDWQHAARMFTDSNQVYGPKQKFLFHVAFHINKTALANIAIGTTYSTQINMLVKSIALPKFTITADKVNQYNRKKNIQQKVTYEDITVKFHDDNLGLISQLWQNYFNYYYADSRSASVQGSFNRTANKRFDKIRTTYGFDNGSTVPFFDYITIYQMAQGNYVSYKLINPIFTSWNHEGVDYSQSQTPHDNTASIAFEAVEYGSGQIKLGDPEGFALQNYDLSPSPLASADLTGASLADVSTTPSLNDINVIPNNRSSILNNALKSVNIYQNSKTPITTSNNINLANIVNNGLIININNVFIPGAPKAPVATATPSKLPGT